MSTHEFAPLTAEELANEGITALPDKEVISILDLAADVNLAIDGAAPIDLAVALARRSSGIGSAVVALRARTCSRQPAEVLVQSPRMR